MGSQYVWGLLSAVDGLQQQDAMTQTPIAVRTLTRERTEGLYLIQVEISVTSSRASMVASAGETDRDLAGTQFPRNCVPYNIIEF